MKEVEDLHKTDKEGVYIDDLRGETLNNDTVIEARSTEFSTLQDMNVYKYVRRTEGRSRGKIIGVRWVDSFKWDIVKSRLVTMFILADTASQEKTDEISRRSCVMNVKIAFLEDNFRRRDLHRASRRRSTRSTWEC